MELRYLPQGPVSAGFFKDRSPVSAIMGPVGSAKTSTCIMRLVNQAAEQAVSPVDGWRYTKWMVVRDTYRNLNRTTVKSFKTWLPLSDGQWTGGGNDPAQLHMRAKLPDGTKMDMTIEFVALGDNSIEDVARGWEGTGIWLNEADLLPADVLQYLYGRCGRYPSKLHGGATWSGAILDYNAPDTENYLYNLFEEVRPDGYALFKQPGGRDPRAENLSNLPAGYYDEQVKLLQAQGREDLVRRLIDNQYGFSRDGKPVYMEYRDDFHCGDDVRPIEGLPIKVDADQGLHPAAVLRQNAPNGQVRILAEFFCDTGAEGLAEMVLRAMASDFKDFKLVGGLGDMHGNARSGNDTETWLDAFNRFLNLPRGFRVRPAPTDKPDKLTSGVRRLLRMTVGAGQPALVISSRCRVARKGFNSTYCFKRMKGANNQYSDKPVKVFPVSDVMNAIEFGSMDDGGYEEVVGRVARAQPWGQGKTFKARVNVQV